MCGPRVEGVHLRGGPIARGGLRWSDRREDFRTEVLGLMKAQMVKNAVIVPTGAKGGFVVKRPPSEPEALRTEVVECYRAFVAGMLDLTDNLVGRRGEQPVVHPPDTVIHDGDDTYLVVAADKGTATFSDIANEIALEYGYWLGDAFASGGSAGLRPQGDGHHRSRRVGERAPPRQRPRQGRRSRSAHGRRASATCPATCSATACSGRGHLRLVAAFDHRHVFVDPDPDPEVSFEERARLFALPRSSWADYDAVEALARRRRLPAHAEVDRAERRRRVPCSAPPTGR